MPQLMVTVTGAFVDRNGDPMAGAVHFTPRSRGLSVDDDLIVATRTVVAVLDDEGVFTVGLQATDDPGYDPVGWTYEVTERLRGMAPRSYDVELPSDPIVVDLADLAPVDSARGEVTLIPGPVGATGPAGPAGTDAAPGESSQYGSALTGGGVSSLADRRGAYEVAGGSGAMYLSYFRVPAAFTAANLRTGNGTPAGATPTLARVGLYRVAGNGDLTLVASTTNDTALFDTAYTAYTRALDAPVALTAGEWVATGILVVSAAAMPGLITPIAGGGTYLPATSPPRLTGAVFGQADLPGTVPAASVGISNLSPWVEILP